MKGFIKNLLLISLWGVALSSCTKDSPTAPKEDSPYLRIVSSEGESLSSADFTSNGGKKTLRVEASVQWTLSVQSTGDWLSASASKGNGNFKFSITASPNYSSSEREGELILSSKGMEDVSLRVVQAAKQDVEGTQIRVMSFNLRIGGKSDGSTDEAGHEWQGVRKPAVVNMFTDVSPDIVLMQECRQEQLEDLQASLSDKYDFYFFAINSTLKEGVNILSCTENIFLYNGARQVIMLKKGGFEMQDWGRFYLSSTPDVMSYSDGTQVYKITLWLKVLSKQSGRTLYLFDTHFVTPSKGDVIAMNASINVKQIKSIIKDKTDSGKSESEEIVFFGGDLNCDETDSRQKALYEYFNRARTLAQSTEDKPTYNGFYTDSSKWTRLDHLYYLNATPLTYRVADSASYGTTFISDHFPIWCDFFVENAKQ